MEDPVKSKPEVLCLVLGCAVEETHFESSL